MPEPRNIWMQAIRASQELALDKRKGESVFIQLLHTNPKDGMIYYERGEAYEYLGEYSLAESDYTAASEFFFQNIGARLHVKHWQEFVVKYIQKMFRLRKKSNGNYFISSIPYRTWITKSDPMPYLHILE